MAERAELAPGLVIAGRYRVEQLLGKGGMGAVYVVRHVKTDEKLALKVLHSTEMADAMALERFQREARAPARIDSDHVVRVTDADVAAELDGAPFLVMELLKGRGLDHEIVEATVIAPETTVTWLRQLARGLDKAHQIGIVHRDLKPENIFLSVREDGSTQVKVLDFGIAKLTQAEAGSGAKTATGALTGTPFYMAPEQLRGDNANVGSHTDVWAIGIIAHKMLCGTDFWTAVTVTQLVGQICYEPIPKASERGSTFGDGYDAWFAKCCARDASQRYATVGEAVEALATSLGIPAQALKSSGGSVPQTVVSARPIPLHSSADGLARTEVDTRKRPPPIFLVVPAVVLLSTGALLMYFAMREKTPTASTPPRASASTSAAPAASSAAADLAPAVTSAPLIVSDTPPSVSVSVGIRPTTTAKPLHITAHPDAGKAAPKDDDLLNSQR
jgi:serine/threonine-protein kinase